MKSLLEQVEQLDGMIHQLEKLESKLQAGRIIDAWRECCRLIAALNKVKKDVISSSEAGAAETEEAEEVEEVEEVEENEK
jgi:cell fate (sporulation/competence/biofilm development) regulator YlbF (YheA/YmcA/DUF963 family)